VVARECQSDEPIVLDSDEAVCAEAKIVFYAMSNSALTMVRYLKSTERVCLTECDTPL
jgi:hypothetical protein